MELHPKKNLIYFIYWKPENSMLMMNLILMDKHIHKFDGQVIIKIACNLTDQIPVGRFPWLANAEKVRNDTELGEVRHFISSLAKLRLQRNDDSITFYAHAKGVSREVNTALLSWVKLLYSENLDEPPTLEGKLFSGCFGKRRKASRQVPLPWHYSGSFYWFKTREVLDRYSSTDIPRAIYTRWFTECFPAWLAKESEAEFRFYWSAGECKLYSEDFWKKDPFLSNYYLEKNEVPNL